MAARRRTRPTRETETRTRIRQITTATREVMLALADLDFDQRRRVLRWVADFFGINPSRIGLE